jgi:hypothetical protein
MIIITEHDDWANELLSTFDLDHLMNKEVSIVMEIDNKDRVKDVDKITVYPKDKRRKPIILIRPECNLSKKDYQRVIFDFFVDVVLAKKIKDARHTEP